MKRTYNQYCGIARALDIVGDRWSLLIVRNLLLGAQRYKELLDDLPGIGTNLLAARLRELEAAGVLRRRTADGLTRSPIYELTTVGRRLERAVLALGLWGTRFLGDPRPGELYRLQWAVLSMKAMFRPEQAAGISETYEFRVAEDVVHVQVNDGTAAAREGPASRPDLVVTCDMPTFLRIGTGKLSPDKALTEGKIHIAGDPATLDRCLSIFSRKAADDAEPLHSRKQQSQPGPRISA